jgi:hypothetical protein
MNDLLRRVAAADPAPGPAPGTAPLDDEARAALATILATPAPAPPRRGRDRGDAAGRRAGRLALAGVLAVAGVVAYLVAVPSRDPAPRLATTFPPAPASHYATLPYEDPGTPARPYLLALADKAERQPPPARAGRYHYVRTEGWNAWTASREVSEWWLATDGSARVGEKRLGPGAIPGYQAEPLPAEPGALRDRLRRAADPDRELLLAAVASVWRAKVVEPGESAAMLRLLAGEPGVLYRGGVTDRGGREGLAFTADLDDGTVRRVVVLDPVTGALLADERVALDRAALQRGRGPAPTVPMAAPFTISYTLLLASGRTDSVESRP